MNNMDTMPHDLGAEKALLGSLIACGGNWHDGAAIASEAIHEAGGAEVFYTENHRLVYMALVALCMADTPPDSATLSNRLRSDGTLNRIGGIDFLVDLVDSTPTYVNAKHYAKVVRQAHRQRQLVGIGIDLQMAAEARGADPASITSEAIDALCRASQGPATGRITTRGERIARTIQAIKTNSIDPGYAIGWPSLDNLWRPKSREVTVIGARPSMGKSALADNIGTQLADSGVPCGLISLEQTDEAFGIRDLSRMAAIDGRELSRTVIGKSDPRMAALEAAQASVEASEAQGGGATFYVADVPSVDLAGLNMLTRQLAQGKGCRVVMLDYLQLVQKPADTSLYEHMGNVVAHCVRLAKELGIAFLCLSQLRRPADHGKPKPPTMADLRDSGKIEEYADAILLLHREIYYNRHDNEDYSPDAPYPAQVICAKNKNGATGVAKLAFTETLTQFRDFKEAEPIWER